MLAVRLLEQHLLFGVVRRAWGWAWRTTAAWGRAAGDVLGLLIGSGGMGCRSGRRLLEQLPKGLGNGKTAEHRLAL